MATISGQAPPPTSSPHTQDSAPGKREKLVPAIAVCFTVFLVACGVVTVIRATDFTCLSFNLDEPAPDVLLASGSEAPVVAGEARAIEQQPSDIDVTPEDESSETFTVHHTPPYPDNVDEKFVECWHYRHSGSKHRGANSWPTLPCIRNNHCGGKRQSPINIDLASVAKGAAIPPLTFTNFDVPIAGFQLVNNGHSVALKPAAHDNTKRTVTGGMLRSTYVFTQLHFHWGSKDGQGSEHLINNKPFEMEMHQVYMNEKYDNATEAVKHPDGFAVLATLYEIGTNTRDLDVLVSNYQFVHKAGQVHAMDPQGRQNQVVLTELLPENVSEFFTYEGSLTTPPCWETVTWTVFHAPSAVKADQLTEYRKLVDIEDVHIANNYRPPQALNGRTVKATFQP